MSGSDSGGGHAHPSGACEGRAGEVPAIQRHLHCSQERKGTAESVEALKGIEGGQLHICFLPCIREKEELSTKHPPKCVTHGSASSNYVQKHQNFSWKHLVCLDCLQKCSSICSYQSVSVHIWFKLHWLKWFLRVWLPVLFQKIELQIAIENYKFFMYESLLSSTEGIKAFREVKPHVTPEGGLMLETH